MIRTVFRRSELVAKSAVKLPGQSAAYKTTFDKYASITPKRALSNLQRPVAFTGAKSKPAFSPFYVSRNYAEVVKVPEMAESISEGTLKEFTKQVGDFVEQDEEIASIETDKIDVGVNAPMSGTITEFLAQPDDTVEVGQDLLRIEPGDAPSGGASKKESSDGEKSAAKEDSKESTSSEESQKKEPKKEEPKKEEPKKEESSKQQPKKEQPKKSSKEPSKPNVSFSREETHVKMNRMRLRIAERLKESQNTAATLTTFNEVDMSALLNMRKLYKDEIISKKGIKFGFMGLFSKACTLAMKEWPAVNASIVGSDIVYRDYVDISVAVATPKGLVTPVVRNAESLDVLGIEQEIANLSVKARDGQLTLEDMSGGTFTISNGGVFGSLMGTPIINMPQCAVLGLHGVKERPVVVDGKIEARPMMYLALTYDHRIVDGREAVSFLRTVKELIEDPRKMLL